MKYFLFILSFFLWSCSPALEHQTLKSNDKISVMVSIPPQKFFVESIGGDKVSVQVMVKPGASPATYEPTIKQMQALNNTDIYFRIGVPFESVWMDKIQNTNPNMKIVDSGEGIELMNMKDFESIWHSDKFLETSHEPHNHQNKDPHIWLSPRLVQKQAETITQALGETQPDSTEYFQNNLKSFIADLEILEEHITIKLQELDSTIFLVFHPSWGYFAKDFGLQQLPIEIQGKEPNPKELSMILAFAQKNKIGAIFVQPQFSQKKAQAIADQINAVVVEIDPLSENYLENMKKIAETISQP